MLGCGGGPTTPDGGVCPAPVQPLGAPEVPEVASEDASEVSPERLAAWIGLLTAPELEGRRATTGASATVADALARELARVGVPPALPGGYCQPFEVQGTTELNVIGRLTDGDAPRTVLLVAHHDGQGSTPTLGTLPGADDNASGVAALLEAVRILRARPLGNLEVVVAFTGAEELGLGGARRLGETFSDTSVLGAIVLDMVGRSPGGESGGGFEIGARDPKNRSEGTAPMVAALRRAAARLGVELGGRSVSRDSREGTDSGSAARGDEDVLSEVGIPSVLLTSGLHEDWHGPGDTAGRIDLEQVRRATRLVLQAVEELAADG